jgi:hypothetical protein
MIRGAPVSVGQVENKVSGGCFLLMTDSWRFFTDLVFPLNQWDSIFALSVSNTQ